MPDIYDQHKAAFANVEAHVILKDGERVATIAFKFPRDGAGRLYAYVHWLGLKMVRSVSFGAGYDKRSAACANAAWKMTEAPERGLDAFEVFLSALRRDNGATWDRALRDAGFTVLQAV